MESTLESWSARWPISTSSTDSWRVFSCEELYLSDNKIILRFEGRGAKKTFAKEAGGHRWQGVSPTEKKGRVHSSTITVAVLPEPAPSDLKINHRDLKFRTYRASGPGGQHRNTSDTAVEVTHIPTGLKAQSEIKSQSRNKELALAALRARLIEHQHSSQRNSRNKDRLKQVGTGMRSDKIRTVSEQRQRVENHVNGKRMKIRRYLRGYVRELH